jgi:hypothetical protein
MYRIAIFPVLFFFLIAVNARIFESYGMQYETLFDMDTSRGKWSFMLFSLSLYVLVFTSMLLYILSVGYDAMGVPGLESSWLHPIALFVIIIVWFLLPTEHFFGNIRFWVLNTLYRCAMAPLFPVTFKDLWFADQLTSMSDVLFELQFIMCIYPAHFIEQFKSWCYSTRSLGVPILNLFPLWCRFMQCIRTYRDKNVSSQLVNAGKYFSSMVPIFLAFADRRSGMDKTEWRHLYVMWFLSNLISTVYKYVWDIYKDWGLFSNLGDTRNTYLRGTLLFHPIWYYIAIIENLILRSAWLIVLLIRAYVKLTPVAEEYMTWTVVFLELFRRFVWNVFRVELEFIQTRRTEREND